MEIELLVYEVEKNNILDNSQWFESETFGFLVIVSDVFSPVIKAKIYNLQ